MASGKAVVRSLDKIKEEINETYNFIHTDPDNKPMFSINMAIDKLHELKEMEFNIKQFS